MVVPATALYAIPPGSVCSPTYPCQINSHATHDFDINGRLMSSASASVSPSQKPMVGGLSCLFSSPTIKSSSYSGGSEELGSLWHDRKEELSSSFRCTPLSSSLKRDQAYQSPVSVFLSPSTIGSSSRSSFMRIRGDSHSTRSGSTGLFSSFVRRALGSYVDYDTSPTDFDTKHFDPLVSSNVLADELPFNMEDNFTELDGLPPYARDLLNGAQSRNTIFRDDFVVKAFCEAEKAHRGQTRESGHPYLQHCVETAVLLSDVGANSAVVAAGLLHDTVDDSFMTHDDIYKTFGAEVSDLVEGVSKLSQLSKLARDNDTASKRAEADRLHTMYLAMAHVRAVLIKLADRLHNMMTLDALPLVKQQRFAKETLEIFVPLANRLGIFTWKEQLENLCFKYLYPDQYQSLSSKLVKCVDEAMVTSAVEKLEQALKDSAISYCCLSGRHKSLYSIYSKMSKKKLNFDEIHDIHGLRLIVETEEDCYKALRVVHQMWSELPGKFKDYILHRKCNGYQSLHTVVIGEGMVRLEVQIRTKEMHLQAEYGIASHWRYKEGDCKHFSYIHQLVEWARWIVTWQCEAMRKESSYIGLHESMKRSCTFPVHSEDCPFSCKPQCASDGPVFVSIIENEKMSVQEFPADSSVMDVLERAGRGSSSSNPFGFHLKEELRPRLNHEPVDDPTCKLKMGDVVELTPTIPDKFLPSCREKIQRMYDQGVKSSHKPLTECREEIQHMCNHDVKPSPVPATTKTGSVRS